MTDVYEFSEYNRKNLIYSFSNMTAEEIAAAKERLTKHDQEHMKKRADAVKARISAPAKPEPPAQQTGDQK